MITTLKGKQQIIYDTLKEKIEENGYPPTVRELCDLTGLKSTSTVHSHLKFLEKNGYILRDATKPRAISIVENEIIPKIEKVPSKLQKPYLNFFPNLENSKLLEVLESLSFCKPHIAIYQNKGNSMANDGIKDDSYLMIDLAKEHTVGKIVLAVVNNEFATVKRFYQDGNMVKLATGKDSLNYIMVDYKNVQIVGTVVGVFRELE